MKRACFLLLFYLSFTYLPAQITGSGTFADPYSGGTLLGLMTWSGPRVYVSGILTIGTPSTAAHLTIDQGVTVVFTTQGSGLVITGLGRLTADGSPLQKIIFTADHDNDGIYGEAGETWHHISFQSMGAAEASSLSHCHFEYGRSIGAGIAGYGGALHIGYSNVTVSDCSFMNNSADWGGAVFVNANSSPAFSNCLVYNNKATHGGGGFYFWNGTGSTVVNCIFDNNGVYEPSVPYYTGGGLAAQSNTSIKIINCTFVRNSSTRTEGQALLLHSSQNARVINSVFWGSDKQIYCYGTSGSVIINSAYQGSVTYNTGTAPVNPLVLNASNSAPGGPHFTATDGSDWSPVFGSPLMDAGINTYPGVSVPTTDFVGEARVYLNDIGALEVLYSRWKSAAASTDWNTAANWEGGVPTASRHILIPAGAVRYPTGSPGPDVSIGAGRFMLMEAGARATVNNLTNNGTLILRSGANAFSSLILAGYTRGSGGTEEIELYLTGGGDEDNDDYKWHYISSPVDALPVSLFTAITPDVAQWIESRPVFSLRQGWVAYDGYVYSTGQMNGPTFSSLTTTSNGRGYNYFDYSDHLYSFPGLPNTSTVTAPLAFSGSQMLNGFNLLGNPFTSGLDWDQIAADPGYPANTSKGIYFTRDNMQCTYINGVGVPADVSGIIPPMQGFFTKTYASGNSIVLDAAARTHDNIHSRYKGAANDGIALVRLKIGDGGVSDEAVVRFDNNAKEGRDNDFDAAKMFYTDTRTYIYTTFGDDRYAVNGLPFPETIYEIPVVVNVTGSGSHTLSATRLQGLANYKVRLLDKHFRVVRNLATDPEYSFTADAGVIADRFVLMVSDIAYSSEEDSAGREQFTIYLSGDIINIIAAGQAWEGATGDIHLTDMGGRRIKTVTGATFSSGSVVQVPAPRQKGIYFVEVRSGVQRHTARIVVR